MKNLFIDSSRKSLSVALSSSDKIIEISNVNSYSKHSNFLMNEIKRILDKFNLVPNDIDNFIVLNGPGSFTGVRVGVTIAKTIAWTLQKKIYQLNNLEALKVGIDNEVVISVIFDKSKDSYVGIYANDIIEDYLNIEDDVFNFNNKNITLVSMGENAFLTELEGKLRTNNNVDVKIIKDYNYEMLINYALTKPSINPHLAEPIYLKKIDAEKNANKNLQ